MNTVCTAANISVAMATRHRSRVRSTARKAVLAPVAGRGRRIAIDQQRHAGRRENHQRRDHDGKPPADGHGEDRHQRRSQRPSEGKADLLQSDDGGPLGRREPRQHGRDQQGDERRVRAGGARREQPGRDHDLAEDQRALDAPVIGHRASGNRHQNGADVIRRQERSGLREREPEVVADQRGDGGDAEWPDAGEGLRGQDEAEDREAADHAWRRAR